MWRRKRKGLSLTDTIKSPAVQDRKIAVLEQEVGTLQHQLVEIYRLLGEIRYTVISEHHYEYWGKRTTYRVWDSYTLTRYGDNEYEHKAIAQAHADVLNSEEPKPKRSKAKGKRRESD